MSVRFVSSSISLLLVALAFLLGGTECRAQEVSLKNNMLYDATLTPNLGVEVEVDSLWSVGIDFGLRIWPRSDWKTRKYRHLILAPEFRRWLTHTRCGHFIGGNILYTHFNVGGITMPFGMYKSVRHQRKQGDAVALGPVYGYSWQLAHHWNLEAEAGADIGYAWYDVYNLDHSKQGNDKGLFAMPRLGINIVYTF